MLLEVIGSREIEKNDFNKCDKFWEDASQGGDRIKSVQISRCYYT